MGKSLALRFMTFMMAFGIGSRTAWLLVPQAGTPGWLCWELDGEDHDGDAGFLLGWPPGAAEVEIEEI